MLLLRGTSEVARQLRKIKTGTARIALSAEAAHNFSLGLKILPVGLNYEDPRAFRTAITVEPGELIRVSDYAELYQEDQWKAVEALTKAIRKGLSEKIVAAQNGEEEQALLALELVAQTENPLRFDKQAVRSRNLLKELHHFSQQERQTLVNYQQFLERNSISDEAVAGKPLTGGRKLLFPSLGLPLTVIGILNHLLPWGIPGTLNKRLNKWPCYDATYKYVSGIVMMPLFYILQIKMVLRLLPGAWWYLILLPASGLWLMWSWVSLDEVATKQAVEETGKQFIGNDLEIQADTPGDL